MARYFTILLMLTAIAWPVSAQSCDVEDSLECGGFKCDFLPSDQYYLGRVTVEEGRYQFPRGISWKEQLVSRRFRDAFEQIDPDSVAGNYYTRTSDVDLTLAARYMHISPDALSADLRASKDKDYTITRAVSQHEVYELTDEDVEPIYDWFNDYVQSEAYRRREADTRRTKYYFIRAIRVARAFTYTVDEALVRSFGGEAKLGSLVGGNLERVTNTSESYAVAGDLEEELTICFKAERLDN
ncbi:MAG: hypothetical protein AAGJ50_05240 [Pseudomonadota bacterium]